MHLKKLIYELEVPHEYLVGKVSAKIMLTNQLVKLLLMQTTNLRLNYLLTAQAGFTKLKLLYTNELDYGSYISDTLRVDSQLTRLEALVEIYRMMRPGEPPTKDAAEAFSRTYSSLKTL